MSYLIQEIIKLNTIRKQANCILPTKIVFLKTPYLITETIQRYGHAPMKVPGNTPGLQALLQPGLCNYFSIMRPTRTGWFHPVKQQRLQLGQIDEELTGGLHFGSVSTYFTPGILQFDGIDQFAATIALIAASVFISTAHIRTATFHKSVG